MREIARGGMGQIYFGEDPQLTRQVAVKVGSVSYGGEDPRFSKEAKVLAHLAHPNIVPIYNIEVDPQNRPFYSMKLVKGRTLQAVKEYTRAALLTAFRKVCDAMAFARQRDSTPGPQAGEHHGRRVRGSTGHGLGTGKCSGGQGRLCYWQVAGE